MLNKLKILFNNIRKISRKPVMRILPGQLAFFFVLSIPPLISLVGIIGSMLSVSTESFITFINESFPASTSNLIVPLINGMELKVSFLLFILGALMMISKGTGAIITTSNMLYDVDEGNNIKRTIKAVFLVVMIIILLAFIIIVPTFGDLIMTSLKNIRYLDTMYSELMMVYNIIKLPATFVFIFFVIKLIYTIAPDKDVKSRDVTYGTIFTTVGWVISTKVYSYYITNFAVYDIFYGNIASLIILLLWIYLLSYIFVLGMALNVGTHSLELRDKKRP